MSTCEIWYQNFLDSAIVTSSTCNANFPLTNLVWPWYLKWAQTLGCTSEFFKWNLGSPKGVDRLALKGHNFSSGATIKVYGHASDLGNTPGDWESGASYKSGALTWRSDQIVKAISSVQTYQWWMLWIQDVGNPDGYLWLGRPYVGTKFSPAYSFVIGFKRKIVDPSGMVESWGGQASKIIKQRYRSFAFQFLDMSSADVDAMDAIDYEIGLYNPYFLCWDTGNRDNKTLYVENVTDWEFTNTMADGRADVMIEVRMSR